MKPVRKYQKKNTWSSFLSHYSLQKIKIEREEFIFKIIKNWTDLLPFQKMDRN